MASPVGRPGEPGKPDNGRAARRGELIPGSQLLLPLSGGLWERVRDGDRRWRAMYERHYSAYRYRDGRQPSKLIGPGEYLLLATPALDALFGWRRFRSMDRQPGLACCIFRNEGPTRSSLMILEAMQHARERWPGETRGYTYVDPVRVASPNPGYCFLAAGWRRCGRSQGGLHILECDLLGRERPARNRDSG